VKEQKEVRMFDGRKGTIEAGAFSPDGSRVLVGGAGTLTLWETETGKMLGSGAPPPDVPAASTQAATSTPATAQP
jgi:hypothetical protein